MTIPKDLKYTKEHEWAKKDSHGIKVGITDYAQSELGDVVFVEVPEIGKQVKSGESMATVESVKAVSDIYAPISGKVVNANKDLSDHPELVNQSPYEKAWLAVIEQANDAEFAGLMGAAEYEALVGKISK